jgi:antitoxin HigA-1
LEKQPGKQQPNEWLQRTAHIMAMHNPPHPGEFIIQVYLEPNNLSGRELAGKLGVAPSTLNRILTGTSRISPEMALRLSKALGRSPESWLAMQYNHDLWQTKQRVKLGKVVKVRLTAA